MGVTAFIPAKMTSRRLPRKNMALLCGQPLIYYSIEAAKKTRNIDDIVVSSEAPEVLDYARAQGAKIHDRNHNLSAHHIRAVDVIRNWYEMSETKPDKVVLLQPTHPLRLPGDLDRALDQFAHSDADCLFAVKPEDVLLGQMENGEFLPEYTLPRNKAKEPARYRNTGSFYIFDPQRTFLGKHSFGQKISGYVLENAEFEIDIDHPADMRLAEAMLSTNKDRFSCYETS